MKKHVYDLCFLGIVILLLIASFFLTGCQASRKVNKEVTHVNTEVRTEQTRQSEQSSITHTEEAIVSNTEVTEDCDTTIQIPDPSTGKVSMVPVKFHRTTKKQEYARKNSQVIASGKEKEIIKKTAKQAVIAKSKKVESKGQPWAMWITIVSAVLLVLLFVFLWKRLQLGRIFSGVIRKSPG